MDKEQERSARRQIEPEQWRELLAEAIANNDWILLKELGGNPSAAQGVAALPQEEKGRWMRSLVDIGSETLMREAFGAGLDPNTPVDEARSTALMRAISQAKASVIPLLMERCEQAAINFAGETAFGFACVARPPNLELIEALIPAALRAPLGEVDDLEEHDPPLAILGLGCASMAIARKLIKNGALSIGTPFRSAFEWQFMVRAQRPNGGAYFKFVVGELLRADPRVREEIERQARALAKKAQKSALGAMAVAPAALTQPIDDLAAMGVYSQEAENEILAMAKSMGVHMPQLKAKKEQEALSAIAREASQAASEANEADRNDAPGAEGKKTFRL